MRYIWIAVAGLCTSALSDAAPPDGFVLTHWGPWTVEEGVRAIEQARAAGARHITLLFNLCQTDKHAADVHWCDVPDGVPYAESPEAVRFKSLVPELRARGLSFSLYPFVHPNDDTKRAWIAPRSRKDWFQAYGDRMVELGRLGREQGADEFIVASELTSMYRSTAGWRGVIRRVREVFPGHLTISVVWPQYPLIGFWDALDSIGVSAYFPLALIGNHPSVERMTRNWKMHRAFLLAYSALLKKPLTFVEVGYPATEVAARTPWDYQWPRRRLDFENQRRCYEAFRRAWADVPRLRAFRIWGLTVQSFEPQMGFSPIGKPAEQPVRALFAERVRL